MGSSGLSGPVTSGERGARGGGGESYAHYKVQYKIRVPTEQVLKRSRRGLVQEGQGFPLYFLFILE